MEDNNKMKLSELKKIIKETIKDIVNEAGAVHTRQGPRASFIGDDDGYKQRNPGRNSTHRPLMTNTEGDRRHCKMKVGMDSGYDYRQCLEARAQAREDARRARLEETDSEQQIEEEKIDEAGCDSHGKREDKKGKEKCPHCDGKASRSKCICGKIKESEEPVDEGKAHKECKNGCQCEPIKEGEEPEVDGATIEEIDEPEADSLEEGGCGKSGKREDKKSKLKSKVMTPEKEKALKENYMGEKRNRLFEKLTKKWTK